jgi:hypothetical protein
MCDRFGDSCGANEAANAACVAATAATKGKTGQAAGMLILLSRCSLMLCSPYTLSLAPGLHYGGKVSRLCTRVKLAPLQSVAD